MTTRIHYISFAATAALVLTACAASTEPTISPAPADAPASMSADAPASMSAGEQAPTVAVAPVIIDVRTPAEFAEGHLEGAINIDVSAPDFEDKIHDLDPKASYAVYCRSGNRSGQAIQIMQQHNFTDVTNAGSVDQASETLNIPVVK